MLTVKYVAYYCKCS